MAEAIAGTALIPFSRSSFAILLTGISGATDITTVVMTSRAFI